MTIEEKRAKNRAYSARKAAETERELQAAIENRDIEEFFRIWKAKSFNYLSSKKRSVLYRQALEIIINERQLARSEKSDRMEL